MTRRFRRLSVTSVLAVVLGAAGTPLFAQASAPQDEEAIRKLQDGFAQAWNQHDATAMAAFWDEDGDYVGPDGSTFQGRARIETMFAEAHTGDYAPSKLAVKVRKVRFLKPDVALVDVEGEISDARDFFGKALPVQRLVYTSILVKKGETWVTTAHRAFIPPPPPEE